MQDYREEGRVLWVVSSGNNIYQCPMWSATSDVVVDCRKKTDIQIARQTSGYIRSSQGNNIRKSDPIRTTEPCLPTFHPFLK